MSYDWITTPTIQFQYLDSVSPKINTPLNRGGKIAPSPISSHDGWDHSCAVSFTDCWCQLFACSSISAKCEEDLQMKIHIVHIFGDHYKVVFPSYNYIYIPKKQQLTYKVVPTSYDYILVYDSIYITIDIFRINHRHWRYLHQLSYRFGCTTAGHGSHGGDGHFLAPAAWLHVVTPAMSTFGWWFHPRL